VANVDRSWSQKWKSGQEVDDQRDHGHVDSSSWIALHQISSLTEYFIKVWFEVDILDEQ
jgi:hypothetical protein